MEIEDVRSAIKTTPPAPSKPIRAESLPSTDIRVRIDEAARRGWGMIGRRFARLAVLVASDAVAGMLAGYRVPIILGAWMPVPGVAIEAWNAHLLALLLVQPLALGVLGAYSPGLGRVRHGRILLGMVLAGAVGWGQAAATSAYPGAVGPLYYGIFIMAGAAFCSASRVIVDKLITAAYARGIGIRRVLVVGSEKEAERIKESLKDRKAADFRVVGFLGPGRTPAPGALGTVADLETALRNTAATGIIISSNLSPEAFETLVRHCFEHGANVFAVPRTLDRIRSTIELRRTRSGTLLGLYPPGLRLPQLAIKRAMDIFFSSLLIIGLSPVMALIAIAIKLDSPGPVLFGQLRAGVGGRPFRMLKFRTMVADADRIKQQLQHLNESGDPRLFKIRNDPRVTRVGRFLRSTSLDELPQLFNVLRGQMSLVGPRPFFPDDIASYEPHHYERLTVLPGITGLWQVSGRSDIVDFEEVVQLDSLYIRNWSIGKDIWILVRTIPAAFGRGGAY